METEIGEQLENAHLDEEDRYGDSYTLEVKDEGELLEVLKAVFSASKTKRVIKALLAQSANIPRRTKVKTPPTPEEVEEEIPF